MATLEERMASMANQFPAATDSNTGPSIEDLDDEESVTRQVERDLADVALSGINFEVPIAYTDPFWTRFFRQQARFTAENLLRTGQNQMQHYSSYGDTNEHWDAALRFRELDCHRHAPDGKPVERFNVNCHPNVRFGSFQKPSRLIMPPSNVFKTYVRAKYPGKSDAVYKTLIDEANSGKTFYDATEIPEEQLDLMTELVFGSTPEMVPFANSVDVLGLFHYPAVTQRWPFPESVHHYSPMISPKQTDAEKKANTNSTNRINPDPRSTMSTEGTFSVKACLHTSSQKKRLSKAQHLALMKIWVHDGTWDEETNYFADGEEHWKRGSYLDLLPTQAVSKETPYNIHCFGDALIHRYHHYKERYWPEQFGYRLYVIKNMPYVAPESPETAPTAPPQSSADMGARILASNSPAMARIEAARKRLEIEGGRSDLLTLMPPAKRAEGPSPPIKEHAKSSDKPAEPKTDDRPDPSEQEPKNDQPGEAGSSSPPTSS